ncbi:MAG: cyclic nucleotide-binding domain-containing protein [Candidatus Latescibacterota bacterium]|nr:cyclic nucleotide-binding domain-containing protein [Candidatus Latescibacterota bacterium]MEC9379433.1 cyclic nucleotide-binding domain-containing protein [Candidatus Latescibacterota bacterium]
MSNERVNKLIQVIRKISLFDGLGPTQIQKVLGACGPRRLEEGEVVCAANTPGDEMYILLSGEAVVYAPDD